MLPLVRVAMSLARVSIMFSNQPIRGHMKHTNLLNALCVSLANVLAIAQQSAHDEQDKADCDDAEQLLAALSVREQQSETASNPVVRPVSMTLH